MKKVDDAISRFVFRARPKTVTNLEKPSKTTKIAEKIAKLILQHHLRSPLARPEKHQVAHDD